MRGIGGETHAEPEAHRPVLCNATHFVFILILASGPSAVSYRVPPGRKEKTAKREGILLPNTRGEPGAQRRTASRMKRPACNQAMRSRGQSNAGGLQACLKQPCLKHVVHGADAHHRAAPLPAGRADFGASPIDARRVHRRLLFKTPPRFCGSELTLADLPDPAYFLDPADLPDLFRICAPFREEAGHSGRFAFKAGKTRLPPPLRFVAHDAAQACTPGFRIYGLNARRPSHISKAVVVCIPLVIRPLGNTPSPHPKALHAIS